MYTPSQFTETRPEVLHTFIREHAFSSIVATTTDGIDAFHVPVVLDTSRGSDGVLQGHVARANPIWRKLNDGAPVLVIFQGPNHYVSPGWYPAKKEHGKVVPTWNYIIVHVRGSIEWQHDQNWLRELLERTTHAHEHGRQNPWHVADAPEEYVTRMLEAIVGFEIPIGAITGKWKLSQNRSSADRAGVADGLASERVSHAAEILEWMRK